MSKLGNKRKFFLGTVANNATTYAWLKGEQTNSFNIAGNAIEVSDKETDWQKFIAGVKGATADATVYADDTDAQQKAIIDALYQGQTIFCFIGELANGGTPSEGWAFEAIINTLGDTNDNNAVATRALSLTVTGAPVHYPTA